MYLQRDTPALLESPFRWYSIKALTPTTGFDVLWHWAVIPTTVDVDNFVSLCRGHVDRCVSLSLSVSCPCRGGDRPQSIPSARATPVGFFHLPRRRGEWATGGHGQRPLDGVSGSRTWLDRASFRLSPCRFGSTA